MSKFYIKFIIAVSTYITATSLAYAADLTVAVQGVKDASGFVGCALFNKEAGFSDSKNAIAVTGGKANPAGNSCLFKSLTPGTYAVAVLHDSNENKKMDLSILGMPTEDWGMSNNVRPTFRAPTFKEASFSVGDAPIQISVKLAH